MMHRLYSALGILGTPFIRHWLGKRRARGKEDAARFAERFGHASLPRPPGKLIWLHAASVGEAQSVLTLARALLAQPTAPTLLVTTGTVTSAALVAQQSIPRLLHHYIPVDTYPPVKRFLDHWRPDLALWVESEFWPQLLLQTHARGIPLLLINARLSARSQRNWQRWPRQIQRLLRCFTTIFASTAEDATRLRSLGAAGIVEAGNLKFDAAPLDVDAGTLAMLRRTIGGRPLWVAASTHANEEQMVAEAHRTVRQQHPNALCVLAPRHAARGDAIAAELRAAGYPVAQRSKHEPIKADTAIYLADTMGELGVFYSVAPIVFLGGSLVAHGGHNPLEPARLDCAILTGPHMHNFSAMLQQFTAQNAMRIVADAAELAAAVNRLLRNPAEAQAMAVSALQITQQNRGATQAILTRIREVLP